MRRLKYFLPALVMMAVLTACAGNVQNVLNEGAKQFAENKVSKDRPYLSKDHMTREIRGQKHKGTKAISGTYLNKQQVQVSMVQVPESAEDFEYMILDMMECGMTDITIQNGANGQVYDLDNIIATIDRISKHNIYDAIGLNGIGLYVGKDDQLTIHVDYLFDDKMIDDYKEMIRERVKNLAADIEVSNENPKESLLAVDQLISSLLCDNREAKDDRLSHDLYGLLINESETEGETGVKEASCDGYAKLAKALLVELGYECELQDGEYNKIPWTWNLVMVGGEWYHIDFYMNDCAGNLDKKYQGYVFLKTDEEMKELGYSWRGSDADDSGEDNTGDTLEDELDGQSV